MKAEDFDRKFDDRENIIEYLDLTKIKRSNCEEQTIAFEFPYTINYTYLTTSCMSAWVPILTKKLILSYYLRDDRVGDIVTKDHI